MKKIFCLFIIVVGTQWVLAQGGKVHDQLTLPSKILKGERNYAIYLPPDYESSERSYPVLYLLHGAGDDHTGWVQFGEVKHIADKAINEGIATPMIIVMPDAQTGQRGYFNSIDGNFDYEDFFFEEFIPFIEKKYRIKGEKRYRAVSGLSMGGGGSLMYALHHPEMFSSSAPLSAYVGPLSLDALERYVNRDGEKNYSKNELQAYYNKHNAIELVRAMDAKELNGIRWYIDCGDDDFLFEGNSLLHIELMKKKIGHEYRVRDGGHTWTYWRESLPKVLAFVSQAFHQY